MSRPGSHFSVHSPDGAAHMSIQSNRPVQVESTSPLTNIHQGPSPACRELIGWSSSSAQRQATLTPNSPDQIIISTTSSPNNQLQIQPMSAQLQQQHQLRPYTNNQSNIMAATTSTDHRVLVDGADNLTLVILDCSPHPTNDYGDESSICQTGTESRCCDCFNRCHCQTELIVRHNHQPSEHHDHICQHTTTTTTSNQNQQQQLLAINRSQLLSGSGSVADRSASQTTTRSQIEDINSSVQSNMNQIGQNYQQQQQQHRRLFQQTSDSNIVVIDKENYDPYNLQVSRSSQSNEKLDENWRQLITTRQQDTSSDQFASGSNTNRTMNTIQYNLPDSSLWEEITEVTTTTTSTKQQSPSNNNNNRNYNLNYSEPQAPQPSNWMASPSQKLSEPINQPLERRQAPLVQQQANLADERHSPKRPEPSAPPLPRVAREGTRLVKRWNWNRAEFVEEEVPDRPQPRPKPVSPVQAQAPERTRSTDVWHQEIQAISPTLSPTPAYDPSWLAYRVPDEQSVQSDPLYKDLMVEIRRLEEGVLGNDPSTSSSRPQQREIVDLQPAPEEQKPAFSQHITPQVAEVREYESVEFIGRLLPVSDPSMTIEWTCNGRPLLESSRTTSEYEFGVVRLVIRRCEAEDSGIYQCRARNRLGEAISTSSLKVHAKGNIQCETLHPAGLDKIRQLENPRQVQDIEEPQVRQAPKFLTHITDYVEKDEGDSVHFECCLGPVDDPDLKTEWFFNGRPLVTGSRFHTIDDFGFIVLDIDWLFPRDTGEYICKATNKYGTDMTRTVLRVRPDKNIVLDSQLDGGGDETINKLRQLEFPDVPQEIYIEEIDKPAHFVEPLRSEDNKLQFSEGDNVHFEARVGPATDGNLTVEWYHNDRPLISGHRFKPTFDFGHILLDILYVYPEDSGVYKCLARNNQGEAVSELAINVTGKPGLIYQSQLPKEMVGGVQKITEMEAMWNRPPDPEEDEAPAERMGPQFVLKPKPYLAFENSCARFCCRLVANPRPRVVWFINGHQVVSGLRYKLTYDGMYHLIIPKCQLSDAGTVRVVARNLLGECSSETELQVKRKLDDYRGVLKNSPNPWYDEATLKTYRRLRNQTEEEDDDDYEEFLQNFQKQRQLQAQREQLKLKLIATEQQATSPLGNQLVGYMEPETPDVNLLISSNKSPLVEPGDLHPVVVEQQVVMAPAPSTIQRALSSKDEVRPMMDNNFHQVETVMTLQHSPPTGAKQPRAGQAPRSSAPPPLPSSVSLATNTSNQSSISNQQMPQQQEQQQQQGHLEARDADPSQQQPRVFGLTRRNGQPVPETSHQTRALESSQLQQQQQHLHQQSSHTQQQKPSSHINQQQTSVHRDIRQAPSPSPENVEHGKEVHSHTHKQTQVERRENKEITREIIEKETFEQEHKGFMRGDSIERSGRGRSETPTGSVVSGVSGQSASQSSQHWQQQQQQQQQYQFNQQQQQPQQHSFQVQQVLIEDYMIPPEFVQKIQPCQAIDGDEARFECVFRGDPQPTISWYRESKLIRPSNLYSISTDLAENKSTLTIKRVTLNGNAVFTVKAENAAGSAKSSANLVVEAHPMPNASRTAGQGRQIDAASHTSSSSSSAFTTTITDVRGETITSSDADGQHYTTGTSLVGGGGGGVSVGGQLTPDSLRVVKSVRTRRMSPDEMASLIRASPEGMIAPTFLHTLHDFCARPGELARLDARLIGSQPMEVRWLKNGQRVRVDQGHKLLLEGDLYTFLILECSQQDEGHYECVASNGVGEARCGAQLVVSNDLAGHASGRSSVSSTFSYSGVLGAAASASSAAASSSTTTTTTTTVASSSTTMDTSLQRQQSGQRTHFGLTKQPHNPLMIQYTPAGANLPTTIEVPKLIKGLESQQVMEGKSVTLRCQISAHPKADVSWYKHDNKLIKPSKYFRIFKDNDETHCLKILETFPEDQGDYKCLARSQNGFIETSATITVIPSSPM